LLIKSRIFIKLVEAVIWNSYLSNMQYTPGRHCNNPFY